MEDGVAAESPPARQRLRQSPSKTSHPGFVSWKEALSKPDATVSRRGTLEQVEEMCRKDDQVRSRELKRVQKEICSAREEVQSMLTCLDNLQDEVGYLKELEEDAREQRNALRRHRPTTSIKPRSHVVAILYDTVIEALSLQSEGAFRNDAVHIPSILHNPGHKVPKIFGTHGPLDPSSSPHVTTPSPPPG